MKHASKHADQLKSLLKKLQKEHPPEPREPMEPLQALVRGALSFDTTDERADEAMAIINREFVDLNELRVGTELEIIELLGPKYPQIEKRSILLRAALNHIFEREHTLNLDRLRTVKKAEVRQFVRELPEINPFVEAYVMLFSFDGGCVPVDEQTLNLLREHAIVEPETTVEEAQKFLESHLKNDECYSFYYGVRRTLEGAGRSRRKVRT